MKKTQSGFAIGYILAVLALVAITSAVVAITSRSNQRFRAIEANTEQLRSQVNQIRNALNICITMFPLGNNGTSHNVRYPAGATAVPASTLTCPGDGSSSNQIFQGKNGGYLNPVPAGFSDWQYVNDASGIYVTITSDGSNDLGIAMDRAASKITGATITGATMKAWIIQN